MHITPTRGEERARNPQGRRGQNSGDFATLISGTAVCRDGPAEAYATPSQRAAISRLRGFRGLPPDTKSLVSPLPTTEACRSEKINSRACACVRAHACVRATRATPPDKGKTGEKPKQQHTREKRAGRCTTHGSRSSASPHSSGGGQRGGRAAEQSPGSTGLAEIPLNIPK